MSKFGFIENIINEELENAVVSEVVTRFPPEPNGYLHIGHAKAICVNFGIKEVFSGKCYLRFDDTNPSKENNDFVTAIKEDIEWLGFKPDSIFYASDYFDEMEEFSKKLISMGKAYVCDLSQEEIREYRGTLTKAGKNSPYRERTVAENMDLFLKMVAGEYDDGEKVLRLKLDMESPNLNMRDPIIYRISKNEHHHLGEFKNVYPMYDYAHPIEDSIEGITHSLCSLEFEDHRPLYAYIANLYNEGRAPRQIEFARLNITDTVMSKRLISELVNSGELLGWDDPRLPTLRGMRRRGYTSEAIRSFIEDIGVAKSNSTVDYRQLEAKVRDDLNLNAKRAMAVLKPLKVVVRNMEEDEEIEVKSLINPEKKELGYRKHYFTKELYIEDKDFMIEKRNKHYRRFYPGNEVRLKDAFYATCVSYKLDDSDNVIEIEVEIDKNTLGGWSEDGRKVKGTIHWVSAKYKKNAKLRVFNRLLDENGDFNKNSMQEHDILIESYLAEKVNDEMRNSFQFLRLGYYVIDKDSSDNELIFNEVVSLKENIKK